jgi:hypothetical protein
MIYRAIRSNHGLSTASALGLMSFSTGFGSDILAGNYGSGVQRTPAYVIGRGVGKSIAEPLLRTPVKAITKELFNAATR